MLRIAIVGAGRGDAGYGIGHFIVREIEQSNDALVVSIIGRSAAHSASALEGLIGQKFIGADSEIPVFGQDDLEAMYRAVNPDAVVIACPDTHHLHYLASAVSHSKHVFVEKPILPLHGRDRGRQLTVDAHLESIFLEARDKGLCIATNCQRSFIPVFLKANGMPTTPSSSIRVGIRFGAKPGTVLMDEHELFNIAMSHPVSILVKVGLADSSAYAVKQKRFKSGDDERCLALQMTYAGRISVDVSIVQSSRTSLSSTTVSVDGGAEVEALGQITEGTGEFRTAYIIDGRPEFYSGDLLKVSVDSFIRAARSGNLRHALFGNEESWVAHLIQRTMAEQLFGF